MELIDRRRDHVLGLYRIVVGLLFACHGAAKLFGVLGGAPGPRDTVAFGAWPSWWAAVIELVGGLAMLLGAGARTAAFVSSGAMAYAYFVVHQPDGVLPIQNNGELAVVYCWSFLLIVFLGPGRFALVGGRRRATVGSAVPVPAVPSSMPSWVPAYVPTPSGPPALERIG
jgi:putative oxidoreductase